MSTGLRRYAFSERLAEILGASRRDLRYRVTLMVTHGLIPAGPRGPGSPPATPGYAADVLIGVLAAPQQADALGAVFTAMDSIGSVEWQVVEVEQYNHAPLDSVRLSFEQLKTWGRA